MQSFHRTFVCLSLVGQAAVNRLSHWESEKVNFEGLRVIVDEGEGRAGWLLNRMSLHEPIVIFTVESVRPYFIGKLSPIH